MDKDEEKKPLTGDEEEEKKRKKRCFCIPAPCCWIMKVVIVLIVVALIGVVGVLMAIYLHSPDQDELCTHTTRNCSATEDVRTLANITCKPSDDGGNFHVSTHDGRFFKDCAGLCCREPACKMFLIGGGQCQLLSSCPVQAKQSHSMLYVPRMEHMKTVYRVCDVTVDSTIITDIRTTTASEDSNNLGMFGKTTRAPYVRNQTDLLEYTLDLAILLDGTSHVTLDLFEAVKDFILDVASKINLDPKYYTRMFVIYVGHGIKVVKSFQEVKKITKSKTKTTSRTVLKKKDYDEFTREVQGLEFSDAKAGSASTTKLLKLLKDTMKKKPYYRKHLEDVHTVWFSAYDEDSMMETIELLTELRAIDGRNFTWMFERWNKFGMDFFEEIFGRKFGIADDATPDETPDAAATEFKRKFWAYLKDEFGTPDKTRSCASNIMEYDSNLRKCVIKCFGHSVRDPANPLKCVKTRLTLTVCLGQNREKLHGKCWTRCPKGTVRSRDNPAECQKPKSDAPNSAIKCPNGTRLKDGKCTRPPALDGGGEDKDQFLRSENEDRMP